MEFKQQKEKKLLPSVVQTIQSTAATAVFASKKASHTNCRQRGTGSWRSTEYTVFKRISFARRNIIFVEGNKFIASFETNFLFLSSLLKNYQEATISVKSS